MRCVQLVDEGVLELNYMWLPTWIGQNSTLKKEIEVVLKGKILGRPATEEVLDEAAALVVSYLSNKYQIEGLFDYLDGLKFVQIK